MTDCKEGKGTDLEGSPCFAIAAILIAALNTPAVLLADFLNQERGLARRAGFGHRAIPEGEFTLGIITACEKRAAFARPLLHEVTAAIRLRTLDAERQRLGRLTLRIA